jgi:glycosyltransferase involved in cell wall biosynthesis
MVDLSVVIATKDRPTLLARALRSVLDQVDDAEVIVVDDGSAHANASLVREMCSADPRVRRIRNEDSLGAPAARNQGLDLARGRLWAALDDDDAWLPGKWDAQRRVFEEHGFPDDLVVVTGVRLAHRPTAGSRDLPGVRDPERYSDLSTLFRRVPTRTFCHALTLPTALMRTAGGFDSEQLWGEYTDLQVRLSKVARFAGTEHVGVLVDKNHDQMRDRRGRVWTAKADGIRLLLAKHGADLEREPRLLTQYRHALGVTQLRAGDRWGAALTFAGVVSHGRGAGRRARAFGHLVVTTVGGPRMWRAVTRLRRREEDE